MEYARHVFKLTRNYILILNIFLFKYLHCKFFQYPLKFQSTEKIELPERLERDRNLDRLEKEFDS